MAGSRAPRESTGRRFHGKENAVLTATLPMNYVFQLPVQVQVVALILLALLLVFLGLFLIPGIAIHLKLFRLVSRLEQMRKTGDRDPTAIFSGDKTLSHLWQEYKDTLHKQTRVGPTGAREIAAYRSTVPAETFFSAQRVWRKRG